MLHEDSTRTTSTLQSAMLHEGSTGTTDTLQGIREGSIRAPRTLQTCRPRADTTILGFRTFSLDREADVPPSLGSGWRPKSRWAHRGGSFVGKPNQTACKFSAAGLPFFGLATTSKETFCPSLRFCIPARSTASCARRHPCYRHQGLDESIALLTTENHFTLPVPCSLSFDSAPQEDIFPRRPDRKGIRTRASNHATLLSIVLLGPPNN